MQKLIVASLCLVALTVALPYDTVQDQEGQHYHLVPISRVRRDNRGDNIKWKLEDPGKFEFKYQRPLIDNDNRKLDATAYGKKDFSNPKEPEVLGGRFDYKDDSGRSASAQAEHNVHKNTNVRVEGKYDLYKNGPFQISVSGGYDNRKN